MFWDGLGDDDHFFESVNRLSSAFPLDLASSSDEDEEFDDPRMPFVSAVSAISSIHRQRNKPFSQTRAGESTRAVELEVPVADYAIWMVAPASITERRKRLLHGMGLDYDQKKESFKVKNPQIVHTISNKFEINPVDTALVVTAAATTSSVFSEHKTEHSPVSPVRFVLVRSRSEGNIDSIFMKKSRKYNLLGKVSTQRLTSTPTEIAAPRARIIPNTYGNGVNLKTAGETRDSSWLDRKLSSSLVDLSIGSFFVIKNLDTGKKFVVKEYNENGMWNRLMDLQTGNKLTMEEFEKTVGYSPVVNELMRRANVAMVATNKGYSRKLYSSSYISRSLRLSKKRGAALLKNIKGVASGFKSERERDSPMHLQHQLVMETKPNKNQWVRVRQNGKSHKELSALHLCQEFQAHEGCIWTIKFSLDGHYLASAG